MRKSDVSLMAEKIKGIVGTDLYIYIYILTSILVPALSDRPERRHCASARPTLQVAG